MKSYGHLDMIWFLAVNYFHPFQKVYFKHIKIIIVLILFKFISRNKRQ